LLDSWSGRYARCGAPQRSWESFGSAGSAPPWRVDNASSDVSELESVLHRKVHGAFGARPTEKGCIRSTSLAAYATYNLMEGTLEVLVVNAAHMKNVPGRKTDVKLRHEVA